MRHFVTILLLPLAIACESSRRGPPPDSAAGGVEPAALASPVRRTSAGGLAAAAPASGETGIQLWLSRGPAADGTLPQLSTTIPGSSMDSAALDDDADSTIREVAQLHVDAVLDRAGGWEATVTGAGFYELSYTVTSRGGPGVQRVSGVRSLAKGEQHRYRVEFDPADTSKCRLVRQ